MTITSAHRRRARTAEPAATPDVRVAIYTRQSVEKAGDQALTSVESQRSLVESYIASQIAQRWRVLPERYDDEGYSGANTARPAFQRLLGDVKAGRIDLVVTYRMDRLSRNQLDFLNVLAFLDEHGARWVSATEPLSTARPEGRAFVSVLMAFAQMEREVTAERVRDKVAESRRHGIWTGGRPVLGYDPVEGKLHVNAAEAETVRDIYRQFLETESLIEVVEDLARRGITNKSWTNKAGQPVMGAPFDKSSVRSLLSNPLYCGRIRYGDDLFDAVHEAIVDRPTWDAAQALLKRNVCARRPVRAWNSLLGGLLRCGCGAAMSHHATTQHGRTYRAYVCQRVIKRNAAACPGSRVRAQDIEAFVVSKIRAIGTDRQLLRETVAAARAEGGRAIDEAELRQALRSFGVWDTLFVPEQGRILHLLIEQVTYTASQHEVRIAFRETGIKALAREGA